MSFFSENPKIQEILEERDARDWDDLPYSQQAAIACRCDIEVDFLSVIEGLNPEYLNLLTEKFAGEWDMDCMHSFYKTINIVLRADLNLRSYKFNKWFDEWRQETDDNNSAAAAHDRVAGHWA